MEKKLGRTELAKYSYKSSVLTKKRVSQVCGVLPEKIHTIGEGNRLLKDRLKM